MKSSIVVLLALLGVPAVAAAHPHIWISQHVRPIVTDGKFTALELEWRFDPMSSEIEIPPIDEDKDGKISEEETLSIAADTLPQLQKAGFMTWLNTGGKDFHPTKLPTFTLRIDDPASFTPPDWDHNAGDPDAGRPMPPNKRVEPPQSTHGPRNLVYTMRFELPQPTKFLTVTTYESDDYIRYEVDKASVPKDCKLDKHPTYKSEYVPGHPVFADRVSCRLP